MTERYYRTGQAAKQLGISSYHVRRLCEAGEISAELTNGQQWRIPVGEISRLEREGVPAVPVELPGQVDHEEGDTDESAAHDSIPEGLYAGPSNAVIEAAEQVKIAENRVRRRRLDQEAEEVEDWFRARQRTQAAEAGSTRQRTLAAQREQRRRAWLDRWTQHALDTAPKDAPREIQLQIHTAVQAVLGPLDGSQPDRITSRLVEAAMEKALAPWRRQGEIRRSLESALNALPFALRHGSDHAEMRQRAWEAATAAIARISGHATAREMIAAGTHALQPMIREYEHSEACARVLAHLYVVGANWEEQGQAKEAANRIIAALPVGTTPKEIERARDAAIAPFVQRAAERKEAERVKDETQRRPSIGTCRKISIYLPMT